MQESQKEKIQKFGVWAKEHEWYMLQQSSNYETYWVTPTGTIFLIAPNTAIEDHVTATIVHHN
jgi:hypothetical protein